MSDSPDATVKENMEEELFTATSETLREDSSVVAAKQTPEMVGQSTEKDIDQPELAHFSIHESSIHPVDGTNGEKQTTVFSVRVDHSGTVVNGRGWINAASDKLPVVIMHDLGQDLGMYRYAAHALVENGFNSYAFDLRGHGRSGRRLGHIPKFETLVKDLLQVVAWVRKKQNGQSPIIMGQGVGGLIATHFQSQFPKYSSAVVLLSPCFKLKSPLSKSKRLMVKTMAEVTPKMRLPAAITPIFSSNVFDEKTSIIQNLTHQAYPGITANFAYELLVAMENIDRPIRNLSKPTLVVLPEDDNVCDYDEMYEIIKSNELVQCINLSVRGHQILTRSKEDLKEVFEHVLPWLNKIT